MVAILSVGDELTDLDRHPTTKNMGSVTRKMFPFDDIIMFSRNQIYLYCYTYRGMNRFFH